MRQYCSLLMAGWLAGLGLLLIPTPADAQRFCRSGRTVWNAGPRVVYVPVYGNSVRPGERYYYVPPTDAPAPAAPAAAPAPAAAVERYFYLPAVSASASAPPRLWQPGDADPGLTHTIE